MDFAILPFRLLGPTQRAVNVGLLQVHFRLLDELAAETRFGIGCLEGAERMPNSKHSGFEVRLRFVRHHAFGFDFQPGQDKIAILAPRGAFERQLLVGQSFQPEASDVMERTFQRNRIGVRVRIRAPGEDGLILQPAQLRAFGGGEFHGLGNRPIAQHGLSQFLFPGRLRGIQIRILFFEAQLQISLGCGDGLFKRVELRCQSRRGNGNAGHGVGLLAVEPFFRHVVEKSVELIKLLLREGVVFVVVALGAADGCSQPDRCGRIDPIHDVLRLIFVGVGAAFKIHHAIAVEAAGDLLFERRVR